MMGSGNSPLNRKRKIMWNYRTQYALSPWAIAVDLQVTPADLPPSPPSQWQWRYQFTDGSQLRGHCCGHPQAMSDELVPPDRLPVFQIQQVGITEYLAAETQTPLLQWQPAQFVCYELGEDLLLLASNDNYVGNSLCLVNSCHRQWAQITHWGSRLVAEPFVWEHFSLHCLDASPPTCLTFSWQFSPFLIPFFQWRSVVNPSSVPVSPPNPIPQANSPWPPLLV